MEKESKICIILSMKDKKFLFIVIGIVILLVGLLWFTSETEAPMPREEVKVVEESTPKKEEKIINNNKKIMENGLKVEVKKEGEGQAARIGDVVTVHYTGKLEDGKVFDSSLSRGVPFEVTLGEGRVIAGWEKGLLGAKKGSSITLTIPAEMGYGERGVPGVIPGGATLIFDIEVVDVSTK